MDNTQQIERFFAEYEARANRALGGAPDVEADSAAFTDCFIEAHPGGVVCFQNDEKLREALTKNYRMQRDLGAKSMKILALDLTRLDDFHTLAKVRWEIAYQKSGAETKVDFDEFYFVQTSDDASKVFAYIAGDQEKLLKDNGLWPQE